jgi:hypothetical protein
MLGGHRSLGSKCVGERSKEGWGANLMQAAPGHGPAALAGLGCCWLVPAKGQQQRRGQEADSALSINGILINRQGRSSADWNFQWKVCHSSRRWTTGALHFDCPASCQVHFAVLGLHVVRLNSLVAASSAHQLCIVHTYHGGFPAQWVPCLHCSYSLPHFNCFW